MSKKTKKSLSGVLTDTLKNNLDDPEEKEKIEDHSNKMATAMHDFMEMMISDPQDPKKWNIDKLSKAKLLILEVMDHHSVLIKKGVVLADINKEFMQEVLDKCDERIKKQIN